MPLRVMHVKQFEYDSEQNASSLLNQHTPHHTHYQRVTTPTTTFHADYAAVNVKK